MFNLRAGVVRLFLAAAVIFAVLAPVVAPAQTSSILNEIKSRKELRVGWAVFYPYIYRDPQTKDLKGFAADFMEEMAKSMNVKLVWVEDSWATLTAGLQSNRFDMTIPGVAITMPRAEVVTFSKPVARMPLGLMVLKKEGSDEYKSWQDLDKPGKRITTTLGSVVDLFATARFKHAEIIRVKAGPDSIAQVLTGKADAWANGVEGLQMVQKERKELVIVPGPDFGSNPICIAIKQGDIVLKDYLNIFIDDLRRKGVLSSMLQKHGLFEWKEAD